MSQATRGSQRSLRGPGGGRFEADPLSLRPSPPPPAPPPPLQEGHQGSGRPHLLPQHLQLQLDGVPSSVMSTTMTCGRVVKKSVMSQVTRAHRQRAQAAQLCHLGEGRVVGVGTAPPAPPLPASGPARPRPRPHPP